MSSALFPKNFSLFNLRHYQRYNCRHGAGRRTLPWACYVLACYLNEALQKLPRFQALPVPIDKPSCALISRRVQPIQAKMRLALFWSPPTAPQRAFLRKTRFRILAAVEDRQQNPIVHRVSRSHANRSSVDRRINPIVAARFLLVPNPVRGRHQSGASSR